MGMDDASSDGVVDLEARGVLLVKLDFLNRDSEGETEWPIGCIYASDPQYKSNIF